MTAMPAPAIMAAPVPAVQVETRERIVEVPQIQYQEVVRQVPMVMQQEVLKEVPVVQAQTRERIVEVPQVQTRPLDPSRVRSASAAKAAPLAARPVGSSPTVRVI